MIQGTRKWSGSGREMVLREKLALHSLRLSVTPLESPRLIQASGEPRSQGKLGQGRCATTIQAGDPCLGSCFGYSSGSPIVLMITAPIGPMLCARKSTEFGEPANVITVTVTTNEANVGSHPMFSFSCAITQTEANGVQTRYTPDGMERVILIERQEPSDRFRPVASCLYNKVGQCFQVEKIDWLKEREGEAKEIRTKQQNQYDDCGEVCQSMDATGMVTINAYDPIFLTRTTGILGNGTVKTKVNLIGKPTEIVTIKSDGTIYSKTSCEYDGRGRLVKERDALGRITDYQFDSFDRIIQKTGPDSHVVQTSYAPQSPDDHPASITIGPYAIGEQQFDGLGRPTIVKQGQRTTSDIYQGSAPNPSRVVLADGATHDISYEPSIGYKVKSITAPEGEESYVRDKKTAAILNLQNKEMTVNRAYSPSGFLAAETFKMQDGNKLSDSAMYSLDGEPCSYTDVHEQTREIEYDAFGRASQLIQGATTVDFETTRRTLSPRPLSLAKKKRNQKFGQTGLINERRVENGPGDLLREEYFTYDVRDRLVDYRCNGPECPEDQNGWKLLRKSFAFDALDNVLEISTDSQDGKSNTRCHEYSPHDPTKVLRVTNTHKDLPSAVILQYNDSGCLTRDEEGRFLEYDTRNRLVTVRGSSNNAICKYHYDALGKLVRQEVEGQPDNQLHYQDAALVAITKGESKTSYLTDGHTYWGESTQHGEQDAVTELWAHLSYTPYGFSKESSPIGFNGQWRDPVTGWYHLGNGGHMTGRDWTVLGVGLAAGILVVSLTAGAGLAVAVGASIAVGAVTDAATGAIYDAATGTAPTLESVGTDMLFGAIGGAAGELVRRGIAAGARAVSRLTRGILEAGTKLCVAGGLPGDIRLNPRYIRFSQTRSATP
ncbi:YD repeat-containing protein [Fusarium phyllophilum]|uniref:YD repeat-containing protein n=1 Tax=Fusarium phyllophilum TaxID=47803 RepID=A0A8H5N0Z7_9HYPO|nr:YD repeat-containing protein [Fusarium phyllophilum]